MLPLTRFGTTLILVDMCRREPHSSASPPALAKIAAWLGCQGLRSNRKSGLTLTAKTSRKIIKRQAVSRPCSFGADLTEAVLTRRNIGADPRRAVCGAGLRQGGRAANLRTTRLRALPARGGTLPQTHAARCAAWVCGKLSASPQSGDGVRAAEPAAPAVGAAAQPDRAEIKPPYP